MKAERVVRFRHFNLQQIGRNTFEALLQSNNCRRHTLPATLLDAFSEYGYLVIATDPLAKAIIESQTAKFVSSQAKGVDLVANLKEIFPKTPISILAHENDTLCIIAGRDNQQNVLAGIDRIMKKPALRLTQRERDLAEVMAAETGRKGVRSKRTSPLAAIELDTSDSSREQGIFTQLLQGDIDPPAKSRGGKR